jgi:transcription initiation factor TFIIH subunit 3
MQKVSIDVLTLPPEITKTAPPIFLQQAAYLTKGIYWRWNGRGGLLQYLHVSCC